MKKPIEDRVSSKDIVEAGLGSIGKIKIIKALSEDNKMATIYALHKKTNLKRGDIKRNLNDLIRIGWVRETKLRNAMYSVNRENEYVNHLTSFFTAVGYIGVTEY